MDDRKFIQVKNLTKHFTVTRGSIIKRRGGVVQAVDKVTFDIYKGETLGLVGESGCGKTTTGRTILQLDRPTAGKVFFEGIDLTELSGERLRRMRRNMQMIFQDTSGSLTPRLTIGNLILESLEVHEIGDKRERKDRVKDLLNLVGLNPHFMERYPHEFSGGQRQRIGIARALAVQPSFIVCDEPISSLDVSIQAQVVNLLEELQESLKLTYLFIAHDLSMINHISDRTAVMYLGKVVELATRDKLFSNPLHSYTQALLSAVPIPDPIKERHRQQIILEGDVPSPVNPPRGCRFNPRCPLVIKLCKELEPEWREVEPDHWVACHLVN